ncbi:unnamed protein product [Enterobius vermicularis]|uniref:Phage protein n=1 Tax=Enterobius vermicularis TaxID=51028 RepID=A0A0N4UXL7_ENTVE|nr:unnamed protein product [Enterobius vermicularis]
MKLIAVVVRSVTLRDAFLMSESARDEVKEKHKKFAFTDLRSYYDPEFFVYQRKIGFVTQPPDGIIDELTK